MPRFYRGIFYKIVFKKRPRIKSGVTLKISLITLLSFLCIFQKLSEPDVC